MGHKVRIMSNHPIATMSPPECWDGKVHEYDGDLLDVRTLGAWLSKRVGIRFNYRLGWSRVDGTRCVFFPFRSSNVHCMWVERIEDNANA
jgi:hypothetical protein